MHENQKLSFNFPGYIMICLIVRLFVCFLLLDIHDVDINLICYRLSVNYFDNANRFVYVSKIVIRIVNCRYIFMRRTSSNHQYIQLVFHCLRHAMFGLIHEDTVCRQKSFTSFIHLLPKNNPPRKYAYMREKDGSNNNNL